MDGLSSTIRIRAGKFGGGGVTHWGSLRVRRFFGQEKREGGAFADAIAVGGERAAELFDGEGAAVQAEAVAVAAGGEAVAENAGEVFRRNADAIVDDLNFDVVAAVASRA